VAAGGVLSFARSAGAIGSPALVHAYRSERIGLYQATRISRHAIIRAKNNGVTGRGTGHAKGTERLRGKPLRAGQAGAQGGDAAGTGYAAPEGDRHSRAVFVQARR
jgi:hypothetical protein